MKLDEVFGVSRDSVASYIERVEVDDAFKDALAGTRQIVIYGSSKQGKTSLLQRHVKVLPTVRLAASFVPCLIACHLLILKFAPIERHKDAVNGGAP